MFLLVRDKTYFEENADELLNSRGISKAQFAKTMGVAPQNINKLFSTKNVFTLCKAADYLNIPLQVLINGNDSASKDVHGCIYVDGEAHLVNSKEEIETLLNTL